MRILAALLALTLASGTPMVSEIYSNPADGDTEFIELYNNGTAVELTNWTIHDEANNTFTFPNFTLQSQSYVLVGLDFTWTTVWNNGGDTAYLRDANGTLMETIQFGAMTRGKSISREQGWVEGTPTPGYAAEVNGGNLTVTVAEVEPELALSAPSRVKTGSAVPISYEIFDGNGDLAQWTLSSGAVLATGTNATNETTLQTAPAPGNWVLQLEATDAYGHEVTLLKSVLVAQSDLVLDVSQLSFPALVPGATVESTTFTVRHAGWDAVQPILDVSDFVGAGNISATQLDVYWGEWLPYSGGLMPLPSMQPGEEMEVKFRLHVPIPLTGGAYGTSFTVTA